MKSELNFMWNDLKETYKKISVDEFFVTLALFSTVGVILTLINMYISIIFIGLLWMYWYLTARQHCRKNKKKEPKAIEDKTFDPVV